MPSMKPRPVMINQPSLPVSSIAEAAKLFDAVKGTPKSKALMQWATNCCISFYKTMDTFCTPLERETYTAVFELSRSGEVVSTDSIVEWCSKSYGATSSGVRGSLSRMVEKGYICRVEKGFYWPADVAYLA